MQPLRTQTGYEILQTLQNVVKNCSNCKKRKNYKVEFFIKKDLFFFAKSLVEIKNGCTFAAANNVSARRFLMCVILCNIKRVIKKQ